VSPFWEEIFQTCNDTGIPLNFHLNASLDANSAIWDNLGFDQRLPIHALLHHIGCAATMSNFMVSGILDKYPQLKIGLIESGAGWVPFWWRPWSISWMSFARGESRPEAAAEGILQAALLGELLVRNLCAHQDARENRRRQADVRDRLPAPDLAVSRRAGEAGQDARRLTTMKHAGASSSATRSSCTTCRFERAFAMVDEQVRFERVTSNIGAIVHGIELTGTKDATTAESLRRGLHEYGVLFFQFETR